MQNEYLEYKEHFKQQARAYKEQMLELINKRVREELPTLYSGVFVMRQVSINLVALAWNDDGDERNDYNQPVELDEYDEWSKGVLIQQFSKHEGTRGQALREILDDIWDECNTDFDYDLDVWVEWTAYGPQKVYVVPSPNHIGAMYFE